MQPDEDAWGVTEQPSDSDSWEVMKETEKSWMEMEPDSAKHFPQPDTGGACSAAVPESYHRAAEPWEVSAAAGAVFNAGGAPTAGDDDGSSFFASSPPAAHFSEGSIPAQPWLSMDASGGVPQTWSEPNADSHTLGSGFNAVAPQEQQWGVEQPVHPVPSQEVQSPLRHWEQPPPPAHPAPAPAWEAPPQQQQHWDQQHGHAETAWQQQQQQQQQQSLRNTYEVPHDISAYAQHYAAEQQQYGTDYAQQYSTAGYQQQQDSVTYEQPPPHTVVPQLAEQQGQQPWQQQQQQQDTAWQQQQQQGAAWQSSPLEAVGAEDFFDSIVPPEEVQISGVFPSEEAQGAACESVDAPSAASAAAPYVTMQAEDTISFPDAVFGSGGGNGGRGGAPFCGDGTDFFTSTPEADVPPLTAPPSPFPAHVVRKLQSGMKNT